MESAISLNQNQILSHLDIPNFSNDLRLIILDYTCFRKTTKITKHERTCWIRLGPHLINDQICLQMTFYTDTDSHILSSFGLYCEDSAKTYYNTFVETLLSNVEHLTFDSLINQMMLGFYYNVYAFCPHDQSTVLIIIPAQLNSLYPEVYFYCTTSTMSKLKSRKSWDYVDTGNSVYSSRYVHNKIEDAIKYITRYYDIATRYGMKGIHYDN